MLVAVYEINDTPVRAVISVATISAGKVSPGMGTGKRRKKRGREERRRKRETRVAGWWGTRRKKREKEEKRIKREEIERHAHA